MSWRFFEDRYCTLRLYDRYTFDDTSVVDFHDPVRGFAAMARAGELPAVTFIDPNFVDEPDAGDNDDAAPGDVRRGQALVGGIVDALVHSPTWASTLFVVTYDEHGGFFDHVNPLAAEFRAGATPVSGIDFYGVRVPTLVGLALGRAGHHEPRDLRSHLHHQDDHPALHERRPAGMGSRVAAANDLSSVLRTNPATDAVQIPTPAAPVSDHLAHTGRPRPPAPEFKDVMEYLHSTHGSPASARQSPRPDR